MECSAAEVQTCSTSACALLGWLVSPASGPLGTSSYCIWMLATGSWSQGSALLTPNPLSPQNDL